ncbi:sulfotransferase family protein [Leptothoe spongobia]|uniref:Sulfotransferase n=1 Tax=Leptothoe spongobia TAU-MAC 1115 TaxID=1967444 RepID=A0A947DDT4_9CYAN|nr:sulfotransferase [Leptothoe spongobia]MBT9314748.1 sulfotransferase [Leptothoe spongobia TAU-MAC 1115]
MNYSNNIISNSPPSREKVKPVQWSGLLDLVQKTTAVDRKKYQHKGRQMSANRLWHLVFPNLSQPIFIIGSPRSGTTFLGSCIGELPEVSYHFEPIATKAAARCIYEKEWGFQKTKWFYRLVYAWLMRIHADGDLRFADKTPRNCFVIDFLNQAFPKAQFIHIIRDGRDAALSHSKKPWMQAAQAKSPKYEPGGYPYGPYARFWVEPERIAEFESTSDIHRCIWAWRQHTENALAAAVKIPQDRYHEIRYEDLISNTQSETDLLLDFLNIDDNASRRRFHDAVSKVRPDSIGGWKKELSSEQLQQVEQEAGELLRQLNYAD